MTPENRLPRRRSCCLCGADRYLPVFYLDGLEIVRCQECGFMQTSATPGLEALKRHYARLGGDSAPELSRFDRRKILRASRFRLRYFKKYTGLSSGQVLEVGSGEGYFLALLKEQGFKVLGVEPSASWARQQREQGIPVINDLLENAPLADASFDAICLFQVLEHFAHPKEVARTLYDKLKPGGYLVLEVPDIFSTGAKFERSPSKMFKEEHLSYFSPETLDALLRSAGFTRVFAHHCDYDGLRIPFGKSLKKILLPLFHPHFQGPLERILAQEMDIHHRQEAPGDCRLPAAASRTGARAWLKTMRKTLTAPLDLFFGYLAYRLDRGASLYWIGRKV